MARIRTIKPEFFTSEDIVSLSPFARLLYIALWCEADKEGRLVWKPKTFKMRYLPADTCEIDALCKELTDSGLVKLYGQGYGWIPGFARHQHVNPRESSSDIPPPSGVKDAGPRKVGKNTREAVFERDGHKCVRCGSDDSLQVDHILPQSSGGPHIMENLRTLCRSCNAGRPVAGKAFEEDLAKDGHTVESLRDKFGIDASILDVHAQGGREGKGREGKDTPLPPAGVVDRFEEFWLAWPKSERKHDKAKCREMWKTKRLDDCADQILGDVKAKRGTAKWREKKPDGGDYIEAPERYLRNRRWEDGGLDLADADEKCPAWCATAGFPNVYEANNAGCFEHTAEQFRDGHRVEEPA